MAAPQAVEITNELESAIPSSDVSNLVVVCIDNDETILDGMNTLMSRWGCRIHLFSDPEELRANVSAINPDILLADYHLDHESGLDVVASVRARTNRDLPAVLITADRSASVRNAARALDVTVMTKPLKPAALRALLTRLTNQSASTTAAE